MHISTAPKLAKIILTPAQIKALRATPVQIIPAPPAGFAHVLLKYVARFIPGSTPYHINDPNDGIVISPVGLPNGVLSAVALATGLIDQTVETVTIGTDVPLPSAATVSATAPQFMNQAYEILNNGAAEFTLGDGSLVIAAFYMELDLQLP